jgi:hypothetical protein
MKNLGQDSQWLPRLEPDATRTEKARHDPTGKLYRSRLGPTQPLVQWVQGAVPAAVKPP